MNKMTVRVLQHFLTSDGYQFVRKYKFLRLPPPEEIKEIEIKGISQSSNINERSFIIDSFPDWRKNERFIYNLLMMNYSIGMITLLTEVFDMFKRQNFILADNSEFAPTAINNKGCPLELIISDERAPRNINSLDNLIRENDFKIMRHLYSSKDQKCFILFLSREELEKGICNVYHLSFKA